MRRIKYLLGTYWTKDGDSSHYRNHDLPTFIITKENMQRTHTFLFKNRKNEKHPYNKYPFTIQTDGTKYFSININTGFARWQNGNRIFFT
jgi:hypothetical protein